MYNLQLPEWPNFIYEVREIQPLILAFARETGEVSGIIQGLSDELKFETLLQLMLSENTSEIEGQYVSREDIISSIRNNLRLSETPVDVKDKQAGGVASIDAGSEEILRPSIEFDDASVNGTISVLFYCRAKLPKPY